MQNEYSLLAREAERELLPACLELGVGFVPYFPLASGFLTGKYRAGEAAEGSRLGTVEEGASVTRRASASFATIERLQRFAEEQGHTLLELAIAGLASRPGVASVIAGATKPEQVRANAAAGDWQLTAGQLAELDTIASRIDALRPTPAKMIASSRIESVDVATTVNPAITLNARPLRYSPISSRWRPASR